MLVSNSISNEELFKEARIRCQQINPYWNYMELDNFAKSVLWLMGRSEVTSRNIYWNYHRINHMRVAARNNNPMCQTPILTRIGEWGFESALEFVFAHFEKRIA